MGGCGRTGKFWQGCYGCERRAGQNLSRLSPSYTENGVAIITCSMGTWRKVVPSKTPPDSPMDFKCWSGDAWGQLAGSANRAGERKHPLGNVPWLCKDMLPCTPRPTRTICCVHYSGAFLGLPNPRALHLLKRHFQGHPWQGDHSWGNRCFVQTVGRSGTKLQPRTCWCLQEIHDAFRSVTCNHFQTWIVQRCTVEWSPASQNLVELHLAVIFFRKNARWVSPGRCCQGDQVGNLH